MAGAQQLNLALDKMKPAILITVLILVAIAAISAIPTPGRRLNDERRPMHEFSKENFRNKLMDYIMNHEKRCKYDYCSPGDRCCGGR
ncbi:hypothetical protein AWC38_SpisGene23422, partial [Stylophora pistillata]